MYCPKCNGYLTRDLGFEHTTHEGVAYHCVNCGNYLDLCILKNRSLTLEQQHATAHKRTGHHATDTDTFTISRYGHVLLGVDSVLDLNGAGLFNSGY